MLALTITPNTITLFSENCRFDYCLPLSTYANLSNPDSQCQFNRSGFYIELALSTTPQYHICFISMPTLLQCLLLIIPFALLGALVVYLMFTINSTVTEGIVNAFVLYVSIASISDTIFFPLHQFCFAFGYLHR